MIRAKCGYSHPIGASNGVGPLPDLVDDVFPALEHLGGIYPGFRQWFFGRVLLEHGNGKRAIFTHFSGDEISGVAIAKRGRELKLSTLWVHPRHRWKGIAERLSGDAFEWLGTDRPLFTVPSEKLAEFSGLLNRWGFGRPERVAGYYRSDSVEFVFNGRLQPDDLQ